MLRGDACSSIIASGFGLKVEPNATAVSRGELEREIVGLSDTRRDGVCRCFDARPRANTDPLLPARVAGGGVRRLLPGASGPRSSLKISNQIVRNYFVTRLSNAMKMPCVWILPSHRRRKVGRAGVRPRRTALLVRTPDQSRLALISHERIFLWREKPIAFPLV